MKRRNDNDDDDDDKNKGAMFPRLHVNDAEKGGPRAPPRNKMALYEQFTIPSQRYNSSVVPPKQNNSSCSSSLVPSLSTSQGASREQNSYQHLRRLPTVPAFDEIQVRNAEGLSLNNQLARVENMKRAREEVDFMVPIISQAESNTCNGITSQKRVDISLSLRLNPQTRCQLAGNDDTNNGIVRIENIGRGNNVSEISMVDLASELDISPDTVVDIIGRKQFWKARSAIVNQQRVFAVQVFELHRLLKVQKLIAGSLNFLLEATAFASKSYLKGSVWKKYSSEFVVKDRPHKDMQKNVSHKLIDKVQGIAENTVPKVPPPVSAHHHLGQPTGYPSPPNMDPKMNPWGYHQASSHQWLVPMMSPSEGLVYKPYPAPGFMGPVSGGYGPGGPNPSPQYQPCMGMPPAVHFAGQGYFPSYNMPTMNPSVSGSTVVQPNLYNPAGQENVIDSQAAAHKEGDMQGSTSSSPIDKTEVMQTVSFSEVNDKQTRVIRVVPHRSTKELADRIFQSIQQERQVQQLS